MVWNFTKVSWDMWQQVLCNGLYTTMSKKKIFGNLVQNWRFPHLICGFHKKIQKNVTRNSKNHEKCHFYRIFLFAVWKPSILSDFPNKDFFWGQWATNNASNLLSPKNIFFARITHCYLYLPKFPCCFSAFPKILFTPGQIWDYF